LHLWNFLAFEFGGGVTRSGFRIRRSSFFERKLGEGQTAFGNRLNRSLSTGVRSRQKRKAHVRKTAAPRFGASLISSARGESE